MHIAICDDNVADRKQLERLLKKESDRRAESSGILYTDSYGNAASLLSNPMQYDIFYIDMCRTVGISGLSIATKLKKSGVNATIVMCCSDTNYREQEFPKGTLFIDKPINASELSKSLDHALLIREKAQPLIELRTEYETIYVTEPDILYAVENGRFTEVTLSDGRRVNIAATASNFFADVESHPSFLSPTLKTVINCRYIKKIILNKAVMSDERVFIISRSCIAYAKRAMNDFPEKI
ncbi:MAG: hypothetical protein LUG83_02005 [Lachnospiraceae bacterium]|nr:hypothetical protein [Lachnospiraceae bacterium]